MNYNPYSQPVADATKSGRPPTVHGEYDLHYCSDQLLPKPTIETFDGDPMDYWAFLNRFTCHVADWLPSQKKFSYLMRHCSERVRQHIQHFSDLHDGRSPYDLAWEELHRRYGQPHVIAQACEECLLEFPRINRDIAEQLNNLSILMKRSSYIINDKRVATHLDSVHLLSALANKFPIDLKLKWVESSSRIFEQSGPVVFFLGLSEFVATQAKLANSVFGLKLFTSSGSPAKPSIRKPSKTFSYYLTSTSYASTSRQRSTIRCLHCSDSHFIYQCHKFRSLSHSQKIQIVKKFNLCNSCLNPGHIASKCSLKLKSKVKGCGSLSHNTTLHPPEVSDKNHPRLNIPSLSTPPAQGKNSEKSSNVKTLSTSCMKPLTNSLNERGIYLDIVPVQVFGKDVTIQTYALLDSGSDRTFCKRRLVDELCSKFQKSPIRVSIQTMISKRGETLDGSVVSLNVGSLNREFFLTLSEVIVVDEIPVAPSVTSSPNLLSQFPHLNDITFPSVDGGSVTMLIGNDFVEAHTWKAVFLLIPTRALMRYSLLLTGCYVDHNCKTMNFANHPLVSLSEVMCGLPILVILKIWF